MSEVTTSDPRILARLKIPWRPSVVPADSQPFENLKHPTEMTLKTPVTMALSARQEPLPISISNFATTPQAIRLNRIRFTKFEQNLRIFSKQKSSSTFRFPRESFVPKNTENGDFKARINLTMDRLWIKHSLLSL